MPRPNRTAYVILGLLADGPLSGYEIRQHIDEAIGYFWHESYGQIYPVLGRLDRRRLIRPVAGRARGARRRTRYGLTAAGRRALVRWLQTPPEPDTVRNEMLLKLFFGRNLPVAALRAHIEAFRERARRLHAYFADAETAIGAEVPKAKRLYWMLTLRSGQLVVEARLRWADEALARLAAGRPRRRSR